MGVVYLAEHVQLARKAAVKVLAPELASDADFRARFLREAQLIAALSHPGIVTVHDAGETPHGTLYLAMTLVAGGDLKHLLVREGSFSEARTVRLGIALADALAAAHDVGLVHRDVKPGNVLVREVDESEEFLLSDFGLAALAEQLGRHSQIGQMAGTVDYMAPEQIRGQAVDHRCDLYALGCVLYHALAGHTPYPGSDLAVMWSHIHDPPPLVRELRPEISVGVSDTVAALMAKDPIDRPQSASEVASQLRALAREPPPAGPPRRPKRHFPRSLATLVTILTFVAIASAIWVRDQSRPHHLETPITPAPHGPRLGAWYVSAANGHPRAPVRLPFAPIRIVPWGDYLFVGSLTRILQLNATTGEVMRPITGASGVKVPQPIYGFGVAGGLVEIFYRNGETVSTAISPNMAEAGGGSLGYDLLSPYSSVVPTATDFLVATPQLGVLGTGSNGNGGVGPGEISSVTLPVEGGISNGFVRCGDHVWILSPTTSGDVQLEEVTNGGRATTHRAVQTLPHARSGRGTFTVACTGSKVWVANARTGQVLSIPTGPGLSDTVTYPVRHATWVSAAGGVVWVTDGVDRELVEIDAATDKRLEAVPLSRYPTTVAARPGYAWIGFRSRPFL